MKLIDLSIPIGIGTPAWPTYEPLQMKYFKRLAPTAPTARSSPTRTTSARTSTARSTSTRPARTSPTLKLDYLVGEAAIVDLSDCCGDYDVYTSKMVEERVEVREGDILIVHTGYHHYGWDQPTADEIAYMVKHPGPDREFALWARKKKIRWIGVDCGSADHPMNTIIRDWMPRQARQADKHFREKYGKPLAEFFDDSKYQLMHLEMFCHGIIHAECLGGDIDLLLEPARDGGLLPLAPRGRGELHRQDHRVRRRRAARGADGEEGEVRADEVGRHRRREGPAPPRPRQREEDEEEVETAIRPDTTPEPPRVRAGRRAFARLARGGTCRVVSRSPRAVNLLFDDDGALVGILPVGTALHPWAIAGEISVSRSGLGSPIPLAPLPRESPHPPPPLPRSAGEGERDGRHLLPPRPRFEGEGGPGG